MKNWYGFAWYLSNNKQESNTIREKEEGGGDIIKAQN